MAGSTEQDDSPPGAAPPALALVEKQRFVLPTYTTVRGQTIKQVQVGWESYGRLNQAKDNAILVTHYFSANSHAAGRYTAEDPVPGYWDSIIGPGKPLDTDRYFVISADSLVNLNAKDPNTITTGPASIDPDTGRPYGMRFPIVTIRDFVNVQKALLDSLGISSLYAVAGPSMGALQALEWASAYPDRVKRVIAVIGGAEVNSFLIGWLHAWASPIRVDPNWNNGDYYGGPEPVQGLIASLKLVTLHANQWMWTDTNFGRAWAEDGLDPGLAMAHQFAVEAWLERMATTRAALCDANHLLYLAKSNQLFMAGHGPTLEAGLAAIRAPSLLIASANDLVFPPARHLRRLRDQLAGLGRDVAYSEAITSDLGHLDGVANIAKAAADITRFLAQ